MPVGSATVRQQIRPRAGPWMLQGVLAVTRRAAAARNVASAAPSRPTSADRTPCRLHPGDRLRICVRRWARAARSVRVRRRQSREVQFGAHELVVDAHSRPWRERPRASSGSSRCHRNCCRAPPPRPRQLSKQAPRAASRYPSPGSPGQRSASPQRATGSVSRPTPVRTHRRDGAAVAGMPVASRRWQRAASARRMGARPRAGAGRGRGGRGEKSRRVRRSAKTAANAANQGR